MFEFGFTRRDLTRSAWAFAAAFLATFIGLMVGPLDHLRQTCADVAGCDWSSAKVAGAAAAVAAFTAALVAVKNLVLKDGGAAKG